MKISKRDIEWFLSSMPEMMDLDKGIEILKKLAKIGEDKANLYLEIRMAGDKGSYIKSEVALIMEEELEDTYANGMPKR